MLSAVLAVLLSQLTPLHPSPAAAGGVPVGNGSNWVTQVIPGCFGATQALTFDGGITCSTLPPNQGTWGVVCPGTTDCSVNMVGSFAPTVSVDVTSVTCNATAPGVDIDGGTSTNLFQVFFRNAGGAVAFCNFPCNTGASSTVESSSCGGFTSLAAGAVYYARTGVSVGVGCVTAPQNLACNVNYTTP